MAELNSVKPRALGKTRFQDPVGADSVWLAPRILATAGAAWDSRALPLLQQALPEERMWWVLLPSFGGSTLKSDTGTYASLKGTSALKFQDRLVEAARAIATRSPRASLKLILRGDDKAGFNGILRIALDGKGARGGWLRRTGGKRAAPIFWWQDLAKSAAGNHVPLAPSLPSR